MSYAKNSPTGEIDNENKNARRKDLLILMERIIGNQCHNGNIQNWGPNGIFLGEGRKFRYPITYRDSKGDKRKGWTLNSSIPDENLHGAYYAFGANELHVMNALEKILDLLESEYGLKI